MPAMTAPNPAIAIPAAMERSGALAAPDRFLAAQTARDGLGATLSRKEKFTAAAKTQGADETGAVFPPTFKIIARPKGKK